MLAVGDAGTVVGCDAVALGAALVVGLPYAGKVGCAEHAATDAAKNAAAAICRMTCSGEASVLTLEPAAPDHNEGSSGCRRARPAVRGAVPLDSRADDRSARRAAGADDPTAPKNWPPRATLRLRRLS
jgi:hypothetical protein